jgi:transcriptional repressor NrdR
MICPCEKKGDTSVVDSRPTEDGTAIRRRRLCVCGERFTTFERIQIRELMVVKKMEENQFLTEINYLNQFISH